MLGRTRIRGVRDCHSRQAHQRDRVGAERQRPRRRAAPIRRAIQLTLAVGEADLKGEWVDASGGMMSAYAIGSEPQKPILPSRDEAIVPDPAYRFHPRFTWTGQQMGIALPFSRRVGSS